MILNDIADGIIRTVETAQDGVNEMLFEPVIRLGVTGLARAGKTVFITSLVANLMDRGRMPGLKAASDGRILSAYLQPQPDDDVPRFDFESHMGDLKGPEPHWPDSTRTISQLRLSLRIQPSGILGGLTGPRTVHLDIVDYPGEWLLDLPLMSLDYATWSEQALAEARRGKRAGVSGDWLSAAEAVDVSAQLDETEAKRLAGLFTDYLSAARGVGLSACAPGRFLMPGDLAGTPALTFCPLPRSGRTNSRSLWRAFERRFESYKRIVVKPFYAHHFARIDRQVILVDALGAIHAGPQAVEDMRVALGDILKSFRPGQNSFLTALLGKRVDKILIAATKADHLHHSQHGELTGITEAMLRDARDRADHRGAETMALALASLRATVEDEISHDGHKLGAVRGTLEDGRVAAMYPGTLPRDPSHILAPARDGAEAWLAGDYSVMKFRPPVLNLSPGDGPPHIRLDRAAEFLIGDRLG